VKAPVGVKVVALNTDSECAQSIQAGRADFAAFLTSGTVVDKAIRDGIDVEKVGGSVYVENLAVALDKQTAKDPKSLLEALGQIINDLHTDGTLTRSSLKWYDGVDLSVVK
jgi:polar amino acid transport system substrate-binding protein